MVSTSTIPPASSARARSGLSRSGDASAPARRALGRRPALPAGRALVGGLLVTVAAMGTFAAYANAAAGPATSYVVAATSLRAGQRLTAADLRLVPLDLPEGTRERAFSSIADLDGATVLASVDEDQLVAPAAVRVASAAPPGATHEVSFALEREKALGGRLQRGEQVDLVATYGSGADAYTRTVVRGAQVIEVESGARGTVGSSSKLTLTVGLASERQVLEALHAVEIAKVTVVRTSGGTADVSGSGAAPGTDGSASDDTYRPDPPRPPGTTGSPAGPAGGTAAGGSARAAAPAPGGTDAGADVHAAATDGIAVVSRASPSEEPGQGRPEAPNQAPNQATNEAPDEAPDAGRGGGAPEAP